MTIGLSDGSNLTVCVQAAKDDVAINPASIDIFQTVFMNTPYCLQAELAINGIFNQHPSSVGCAMLELFIRFVLFWLFAVLNVNNPL